MTTLAEVEAPLTAGDAAEAAGDGEEARRIDIRDAQGVQVGDQNRQYNNVGTVVEAEHAQTVTAHGGTAVGVQGGSAYVGAGRTDGSASPAEPRLDGEFGGRPGGGAGQQGGGEGGVERGENQPQERLPERYGNDA